MVVLGIILTTAETTIRTKQFVVVLDLKPNCEKVWTFWKTVIQIWRYETADVPNVQQQPSPKRWLLHSHRVYKLQTSKFQTIQYHMICNPLNRIGFIDKVFITDKSSNHKTRFTRHDRHNHSLKLENKAQQ